MAAATLPLRRHARDPRRPLATLGISLGYAGHHETTTAPWARKSPQRPRLEVAGEVGALAQSVRLGTNGPPVAGRLPLWDELAARHKARASRGPNRPLAT
jgi:hypothetical protein